VTDIETPKQETPGVALALLINATMRQTWGQMSQRCIDVCSRDGKVYTSDLVGVAAALMVVAEGVSEKDLRHLLKAFELTVLDLRPHYAAALEVADSEARGNTSPDR